MQASLGAKCGSDGQTSRGPGTVLLLHRVAIHHLIRARLQN